METIHFIYNPSSGKGKGEHVREAVEARMRLYGVPHAFWATSVKGDAREHTRRLTEAGESRIVAVGGDGTLHEVVNGLAEPQRVKLGLIPCGSGNDFAAAAGIPQDPVRALKLILSYDPLPTDYLECSGVRGINIIGAGIDVDILRRCYRARFLKGSLNYFVSLLSTLRSFEFRHMSTRFGSQSGEHDGLIVCACNGVCFGGGITICPEAVPDDGLLDVVIVEDIRRSQIPLALVQLMAKRLLKQPFTVHEQVESLSVTFDRPMTVEIDGELYDDLPFDVRVVKGGLMMHRQPSGRRKP